MFGWLSAEAARASRRNALRPRAALRRRRAHDLDGHGPVQPRVECAEDLAHAALADAGVEAIVPEGRGFHAGDARMLADARRYTPRRDTCPSVTWCRVLEDGVPRPLRRRSARRHRARRTDPTAPDRTPGSRRCTGASTSAGRARSACRAAASAARTFALGVLQGLALRRRARHVRLPVHGLRRRLHRRLVHRVAAPRRARRPRRRPARRSTRARDLAPARPARVDDVSPVERVRRTCRYLAPRGGVVSADVWTLVDDDVEEPHPQLARHPAARWRRRCLIPRRLLRERPVRRARVRRAAGWRARSPATPASWAFLIAGISFVVAHRPTPVVNLVGLGGRWSQGRFLGVVSRAARWSAPSRSRSSGRRIPAS